MNHEIYMRQAFDLALKGMGHVSPNPLVGAVIVRDGIVLGRGYHQKYGSAHAEVNAILDAQKNGNNVVGATLYCNLEPCSHEKKQTPPCAPLIVKEKISRVVVSNVDPNPHVNGAGVELLKKNGIEVITGVLENEGKKLNEVFFKFIKTNTPFVHLKIAQSLDGRVATKSGESKYITGAESRAKGHSLRQKYDCIIVGRKTVELDDPSLTIRTEEFEKKSQPLRIVVGKLNGINKDCKVFQDEFRRNTMFVTTNDEIERNKELVHFLEMQGVALLSVPQNADKQVDLPSLLKSLAGLKFTSVLVEGGPSIATSFLKLDLVDKISLFTAPVIIGEGRNSVNDVGVSNLIEKREIHSGKIEMLGADFLFEGYLCLRD